MNKNVFTVTNLTREIKEILETTFSQVLVEGQISNLTKSSSGHVYFSLKDENAQIDCVIWRSAAIKILNIPQNGKSVVLRGQISLYEKSGRYQISVWDLFETGVGELQRKFEEMKTKLFAEGLFDETRKKTLPNFPLTVGIVTSPTGAAIHDIHSVFLRNAPCVKLILFPAKVQGEGAALEIANAIEKFNEKNNVDVLIVGRGGGSLEDLWCFNEEIVARAIANSKIPVVSAVGHEVDFSISDFVADCRAATPTAAAELLSKPIKLAKDWIENLKEKLNYTIKEKIRSNREKIDFYKKMISKERVLSKLRYHQQTLDGFEKTLKKCLEFQLQSKKNVILQLETKLKTLNPEAFLKRGFTICTDENGKIINSARLLEQNQKVKISFVDGKVLAEILDLELEKQ
ncbi:exodeoxyribonuclease VII large subunit [bacterium]|nr:exodeoxyribonuclease VII large subunit [bacterium]